MAGQPWHYIYSRLYRLCRLNTTRSKTDVGPNYVVLAHPISRWEWSGTVKYPTFGPHDPPSAIGVSPPFGCIGITFHVCHHLVRTNLCTSSNDCSPHLAFPTPKRHRLFIRQVRTRRGPENRQNVRAWPMSVQDGIRCATEKNNRAIRVCSRRQPFVIPCDRSTWEFSRKI